MRSNPYGPEDEIVPDTLASRGIITTRSAGGCLASSLMCTIIYERRALDKLDRTVLFFHRVHAILAIEWLTLGPTHDCALKNV